jgi:hypothetical protein
MVNSDPSFERQPEVINGASDLLQQIFVERGKHARSAWVWEPYRWGSRWKSR